MRLALLIALLCWPALAPAQTPPPAQSPAAEESAAPEREAEGDAREDAEAQPWPGAQIDEAEGPGTVGMITVDGSINPGTSDYILAGVEWAEREKHRALVVKLDTPGGLLDATRDIVKKILGAKVPVIVWVAPGGARAGSAGVFITISGHVAAMAPGTNIGAAHPVTGGGKDPEEEGGEHMAAKIENDTVAFVRSIAKERGRNVEWAERAVRDSVSITAEEAKTLNVVDFLARDMEELLEQAHGRVVDLGGGRKTLVLRGARVVEHDMNLKQKVVNTFADPNIAYMLLTIGMIGILAELYHPGTIFPGVLGAICLLLGFISMQVLPISYGAVALLVLGVALLAAEMFTPTYGILGIGGVVAMALGGALLIDDVDPDFYVDGTFSVSWTTIIPTTLLAAAFVLTAGYFVVRARVSRPVTGAEGMVGELGKALSAIGPGGGRVAVHGEYWGARSEAEIPAGAAVRVVRVEGLKIWVEPA